MTHANVRERAEHGVVAVAESASSSPLPPCHRGGALLPVTRTQEGMLFMEELRGDRPSPFHLLVSAEVRGNLNLAWLRRALAILTARHPALRTVFTASGETDTRQCRVLPTWEPTVIERHLVAPAGDAGLIAQAHVILAPMAEHLLRPFERPPIVFVVTHAGPEHAVISIIAHHAIVDGWSIGLIWEQIVAGLEAEESPDHATAPGMDVIVALERNARTTDLLEQRVAMLTDWPTVTSIPSDVRRPNTRTLRSSRLPFTLTTAANSGCTALASTLCVSRNVVLLAAWALVVARRTDTDRLLIGVPTIGRSSPESLGVVGGCAGLAPVRCHVPAQGSVTDYIRGIAGALQETLKYSRVPFEDLVASMSAGGDTARNPLIQISFGAHNEVVPAQLQAGDLQFDISVGFTGATAYDAMVHVMRGGPDPRLELEYAVSALSALEAAELIESLDCALVEMATAPTADLAGVEALSTAQRSQLASWASGVTAEPNSGLWQLLRAVAQSRPEAPAVTDSQKGQCLSYGELIDAAAAESARLADAGVREGNHVAVAVSRSVAEIVAILAIIRLGAAYVGVDPNSPPYVLSETLKRAEVRVVLTDADPANPLELATEGLTILAVGPPWPRLAPTQVRAAADPDPERTAYIAFTSGTTGPAKGTVVPCRAVVRLANNPSFLSPGATDRFVRLAPLAFDASTLEIFAPLLAGGNVEVFAQDHIGPNAIAAFVKTRSITGLWLTAGLFRLVADFRPDAFNGVVQLLTGGDSVPAPQVSQVLRACGGLRITNGYGPTENTTFTTVYHIDSPLIDTKSALPIGRPIQGTRVVVLNQSGGLAPPGGIGELYAAGLGLGLGYINMPDETEAAFGAFCRDDSRPHYRTGDLVRWDATGNLRFLGRRDRQIKTRGFRVELDHVAWVIRQHPEVRDVAVAATPSADGENGLIAAVVCPDQALAAVRSFASQRLSAYAVPVFWTAVSRMPLTMNGKLDVVLLAAMAAASDHARADDATAPACSETLDDMDTTVALSIEESIARAWRTALGHGNFDNQDWFFEVGGDSLLLLHVHSTLRNTQADWPVTMGDLYTYPSIDELAARVRTLLG